MTPFEEAEAVLAKLRVILRKVPGEFSVTCGTAQETFEGTPEGLVLARAAGLRMAAKRPAAPSGKRPCKPDHLMKPKYRIRRRNRRLGRQVQYAGRGRMT